MPYRNLLILPLPVLSRVFFKPKSRSLMFVRFNGAVERLSFANFKKIFFFYFKAFVRKRDVKMDI